MLKIPECIGIHRLHHEEIHSHSLNIKNNISPIQITLCIVSVISNLKSIALWDEKGTTSLSPVSAVRIHNFGNN